MAGRIAHAVVLGAHWQTVADTSPLSIPAPLIRPLVAAESENESGGSSEGGNPLALRALLATEPDAAARQALLLQGLRRLVCRVMRLSESDIGSDDAFSSRGMDSMMAIELKNRIEHELQVRVAIVDLLKGATANSLVTLVSAELSNQFAAQSVTGEAAAEAPLEELAQAMQAMTPEEIEALLSAASSNQPTAATATEGSVS